MIGGSIFRFFCPAASKPTKSKIAKEKKAKVKTERKQEEYFLDVDYEDLENKTITFAIRSPNDPKQEP